MAQLQPLFVDVANRASHFMKMVVSKSLALDEIRVTAARRGSAIKESDGGGRNATNNTWWLLPAPRLGCRAEAAGESLLLWVFHDFTPFRFVLGVQFIGLRSTGSREGKEKLPLVLPGAGHGGWR